MDVQHFKIHELKTDPENYTDIEDGLRLNTIRVDDRMFNEGDYLILRKTKFSGELMADTFNKHPLIYTGKALMCKITHIYGNKGMAKGYVVLSFQIIDRFPGIADKFPGRVE